MHGTLTDTGLFLEAFNYIFSPRDHSHAASWTTLMSTYCNSTWQPGYHVLVSNITNGFYSGILEAYHHKPNTDKDIYLTSWKFSRLDYHNSYLRIAGGLLHRLVYLFAIDS